MSHASLKVNGRLHVVDVDPKCLLLYVLVTILSLSVRKSSVHWIDHQKQPAAALHTEAVRYKLAKTQIPD